MRILVLLIFVFQIMFSSLAQAADLRFDPDNDGTDNVIIHEDSKVTVGDYTLPSTDGAADQVLSTDGAGNVAWQDIPASELTVGGTEGQMQFNKAGNLTGSDFIFDDTNSVLKNINVDVTDLGEGDVWEANQVLHLKSNETAVTTTVLNDGSGPNGSIIGGRTASSKTRTGKVNNAFDFDGSNDYIAFSDNAIYDIKNTVSAFAWVYPHTAVKWAGFVGKYATDIREWMMMHGDDPKDLAISFGTSSGSFHGRVTSVNQVFTQYNKWYHIGFTYNNGQVKMYVNGQQIATSGTAPSVLNNENAQVWIGRQSSEYINGLMDDVRVFNKELSVGEIAYIYNLGSGREENLPAGYQAIKNTLIIHDPAETQALRVKELTKNDTKGNLYVSGKTVLKDKAIVDADLDVTGNLNITGQVNFAPDSQVNLGNYTLPSTDGAANQVLATDGAGNAVWQDAASGFDPSADVTFTGSVGVGDYTLPTADGTAEQVLSTDGAGNLSWKDVVVNSVTNLWTETAGRLFRNSKVVVGSDADIASSAKLGVNGSAVIGDVTKAVTDQSTMVTLPELKAHYKMDDNSSSKIVIDETGNFNGTATNNTDTNSVAGTIGGALRFDNNETIIIPNMDLNVFTFSARVKRNSISIAGDESLFLSINDGGWGLGFRSDNTIGLTKVGHSIVLSTGKVTSTTEYVLITVVFENSNVSFYFDGVLDSVKPYNVTFNSSGSYTIGSRGTGGSKVAWFDGSIDDLRIYPVALTADQVALLYNEQPEDNVVITNANQLPTTTAFTKSDYRSKNIGVQDSTVSNVAIEGKLETLGETYHENNVFVKGDLNVTGQVSFDSGSTLTVGDYTMPSTDGAANQVLGTDGAGNAVWQDAASGFGDYTLPAADGTADQVLSTDGAGNLSWKDAVVNSVTNLWTETAGRLFRNSKVVVNSEDDIAANAEFGVGGDIVAGDLTKVFTDGVYDAVYGGITSAGDILSEDFETFVGWTYSDDHTLRTDDGITSVRSAIDSAAAGVETRSVAEYKFAERIPADQLVHVTTRFKVVKYPDSNGDDSKKGGYYLHYSSGGLQAWLYAYEDGLYSVGYNTGISKFHGPLTLNEYHTIDLVFDFSGAQYSSTTKVYIDGVYATTVPDSVVAFNGGYPCIGTGVITRSGDSVEAWTDYVIVGHNTVASGDDLKLNATSGVTYNNYKAEYVELSDNVKANFIAEGKIEAGHGLYTPGELKVSGDANIKGNVTVGGALNFDSNNDGIADILLGNNGTITVGDYTLPATDGATNQVLVTDGNGNLVWVDKTDITSGAYTLPTVDGNVGQVLITDGAGNVVWQDAPSVVTTAVGIDGQVQFNDNGSVGAADFTFDKENSVLKNVNVDFTEKGLPDTWDQTQVLHVRANQSGDATSIENYGIGSNGYFASGNAGSHSVGGKINNAFSFNGSTSYVTSNDYLIFNDEAAYDNSSNTLSAFLWVNPDERRATTILLGKYDSLRRAWRIQHGGNGADMAIEFGKADGSLYSRITARNVFKNLHEWVHVGFTYNNGVLKVYRNGVEVSYESSAPAQLSQYSAQTIIGKNDALLDDIRIFNTALPAEQIAFIYNSGAGNEGIYDFQIPKLNNSLVIDNPNETEPIRVEELTQYDTEGNLYVGGKTVLSGDTYLRNDLHVQGNFNVNGQVNFDNDGDGTADIIVNPDGTLTVGEYTLPATDGTADQVLVTDGNGNLVWVDQEDVTAGAYTLPVVDGADGQVLVTDGAGNIAWQDQADDFSGLYYDDVNNVVKTDNKDVTDTGSGSVDWSAHQVLHLNFNEDAASIVDPISGNVMNMYENNLTSSNFEFLQNKNSANGQMTKANFNDFGSESFCISIMGRMPDSLNGTTNRFFFNNAYNSPAGLSLYVDESELLVLSLRNDQGNSLAFRCSESLMPFQGKNVGIFVLVDRVNSLLKFYVAVLEDNDLNPRQLGVDIDISALTGNIKGSPVYCHNMNSTWGNKLYFEFDQMRWFKSHVLTEYEINAIWNGGRGTEQNNATVESVDLQNGLAVMDGANPINSDFIASSDKGWLAVTGKSHLIGDVQVDGGLNVSGQVNFDNNNDGTPDVIVNQDGTLTVGDYTLPATDGGADQVLATDGNGNLVWVDQADVTAGAYTLPTVDGADGQMLVTDGAGNVSWVDSQLSDLIGQRFLVGGVENVFELKGDFAFSSTCDSTAGADDEGWALYQNRGDVLYTVDDSEEIYKIYSFSTTDKYGTVAQDLGVDGSFILDLNLKLDESNILRPSFNPDSLYGFYSNSGATYFGAIVNNKVVVVYVGKQGITLGTAENGWTTVETGNDYADGLYHDFKVVYDDTNKVVDIFVDGSQVANGLTVNYDYAGDKNGYVFVGCSGGNHSITNTYFNSISLQAPSAVERTSSAIGTSSTLYSNIAVSQKDLVVEGQLDVQGVGDNRIKGKLSVENDVNVAGNLNVTGQVSFDQNSTVIIGDYTMPATDGGTDQVLATDGNGNLVWVDQEDVTSGAYTLPVVDGADGQILVTDGAGNVSWIDVPSDDKPFAVTDNGGDTAFTSSGNYINDDCSTLVGWTLQQAGSSTTVVDDNGLSVFHHDVWGGGKTYFGMMYRNSGWTSGNVSITRKFKAVDTFGVGSTVHIQGVMMDFWLNDTEMYSTAISSDGIYRSNGIGTYTAEKMFDYNFIAGKYYVVTYDFNTSADTVDIYVDGILAGDDISWPRRNSAGELGRIRIGSWQNSKDAYTDYIRVGSTILEPGYNDLLTTEAITLSDYHSPNIEIGDNTAANLVVEGIFENLGKTYHGDDVNITGDLFVSGQVNFDNNNDGTADLIVNQDGTVSVGEYTFPSTDGAANQVLITDGNGNLVWVDQEDVTAGAYTLPTVDGTDGQILVTDGSGNVSWIDIPSTDLADNSIIMVEDLTSTAIQAAIDSLTATGGVVELLAATYVVDSAIVVPDDITLVGKGKAHTVLDASAFATDHVIKVEGADITLKDFRVNGTNVAADFDLINVAAAVHPDNLVVDGLYLYQSPRHGIYAERDDTDTSVVRIQNSVFDGANRMGFYWSKGYLQNTMSVFENNIVKNNIVYGIAMAPCQPFTISNNTFVGNKGNMAVKLYTDQIFTDNFIDHRVDSARGIYLERNNNIVENNTIVMAKINTTRCIESNAFHNIISNNILKGGMYGIIGGKQLDIIGNRFQSSTYSIFNTSGARISHNSDIYSTNSLYVTDGNNPVILADNHFTGTITDVSGTGIIYSNNTIEGTLTVGDYTLPATDGIDGQILVTDGAGNISWVDAPDNLTQGTQLDVDIVRSNGSLLLDNGTDIIEWTSAIVGDAQVDQIIDGADTVYDFRVNNFVNPTYGKLTRQLNQTSDIITWTMKVFTENTGDKTADDLGYFEIYDGGYKYSVYMANDGFYVHDSTTDVEIGDNIHVDNEWITYTMAINTLNQTATLYKNNVLVAENFSHGRVKTDKTDGLIGLGCFGYTQNTTMKIDYLLVGDDLELSLGDNLVFGGTLTVGDYTLPSTDGAANQVLVTDGNGNLVWVDQEDVTSGAYTLPAVDGTDGQVLSTDGAGNVSWIDAPASSSIVTGSAGYIKITDTKPAGTNGGDFNAGVWQTRDLTTIDSDAGNNATLNSNQFTLKAGTYDYYIASPAYRVDSHQIRLFNVTAGSVEAYGLSSQTYSGDNVSNLSVLSGRLTVSSDTTYAVQHRCDTGKALNGLGVNTNFGGDEVYTVVELRKIGQATNVSNANSGDYIKVSDTRAPGLGGGAFISGEWRTRVVNTIDSDVAGHSSINNNQITLAAGTYECNISAPAYSVDRHQTRLFNVTDNSIELVGTAAYSHPNNGVQTRSHITGRFTIDESKTFEIQHRAYTTAGDTNGFGVNTKFEINQVFTIAEFRKVGASTSSGSSDIQSNVPTGGIIMWSGAVDAVPEGWALCDGTNGTPDLRDRFVVGAGNSYAVAETGGEDTHTLTKDEMPSHNHMLAPNTATPGTGPLGGTSQYAMGVNGVENRTVTYSGGNQAHENRPPYYAMAYIMKV